MKIDTEEIIEDAREKGWPIANEDTVRELVFAWKETYERAINRDDRNTPVSFVDGFMAVSNFTRLVLEDLESRTELPSLAYKREFRILFLRTLERGLLQRLLS